MLPVIGMVFATILAIDIWVETWYNIVTLNKGGSVKSLDLVIEVEGETERVIVYPELENADLDDESVVDSIICNLRNGILLALYSDV